jgi:hypothetical protein
MATITLASYRKILNTIWRPQIGGARRPTTTRSVCCEEAETLIAAIHRDWGEAQGNYDEFRFFTGMRPSEQLALLVTDFDIASGMANVNKA